MEIEVIQFDQYCGKMYSEFCICTYLLITMTQTRPSKFYTSSIFLNHISLFFIHLPSSTYYYSISILFNPSYAFFFLFIIFVYVLIRYAAKVIVFLFKW